MILHAYGDSWTEGEGTNRDIETSLKNQDLIIYRNNHSWVKLLSDKLEVNSINNGKSGNPNSVIFNSIIDDITNQRIKKDDLVIIMWSSSLRDYAAYLPRQQWVSWSLKHLINRPDKSINSYKSDNEKYDGFLKEYKNFFLDNMFNQNYYNIVNQNYIIFLQKLMDFYNIKHIMVDAFDRMVDTLKLNDSDNYLHLINTDKYWNFNVKTMRDFLEDTKSNCFENTNEPGKHPNEYGYKIISEEIYSFIKLNNFI
jgi:lysophospholipase L1-like esterase